MWEKLRKKAKAIRLEGTTEGQASRVIGHKALDLCFNPLAHGFKKRRKITYCFRWQQVINLLAWTFSHCKPFSNKLYKCQVQLVLKQHGFNCMGHLICRFLSIHTCTVFDLQLGVCECREPTVCISLHHFIERPWAYMDFCILGGPGINPPWILRDNLDFWGFKSYTLIFDCAGFGAPNRHVVQGSTIYKFNKHNFNF